MENEEFGRIFVIEVRDNAIATIDEWVTRNPTVSQEQPAAIADLQRILPDLVQCTIEVSADFLTSDSYDFMQLDPTETVWTSAQTAPTQAGAVVRFAPADMPWGDRYASVTDPFGHEWTFATRIEEVTEEQMAKRLGN